MNTESPLRPEPSMRKPESPAHIRIPSPLQADINPRPKPKGVLPTPRNIFHPKRGGYAKAQPPHLERIYPLPRHQPRPSPPSYRESRLLWQDRMSHMRRRNLKQSLTALARRQTRRQALARAKSERKAIERQQLLTRPLPDAERWTRVSQTREITAPLHVKAAHLYDPRAAQRQAEKLARHAAKTADKAAAQQDDLHTLFMRARDFIVTEEQLDKEIDDAFGTPERPANWDAKPSVWAQGPPPGLQDLLDRSGQRTGGQMSKEGIQARERMVKDRLKRVAEGLTGGKM